MHPVYYRRALLCILFILIANATFSGAAAEAPRGPLGGAYIQLTPEDLHLVRQATARLLIRGKPGNTASWKNEASGNFGTMELEGSFRSLNLPCKRIDHIIQFKNESDPRLLRLTFCRKGGVWKLAG